MASVFTSTCFLFLRNPRGGVEDLDRMQAAGFKGVFCNIGDHAPGEWEAIIRPRALQLGMFCGPWARTQAADGGFSEIVLNQILQCADRWGSPLIVNSESELKGSGATLTTIIRDRCGARDAALSMEPQPFANVEWWPLADMPVLPQIFGLAQQQDWFVKQWHDYGVRCVFPTFGTWDWGPNDYTLQAPYSLYTADDCGGDYGVWSPRSTGYQGCLEQTGVEMLIGPNDGITAMMNRLRDLDPGGTRLVKGTDGKWPPVDTLTVPVKDWKAYDKAERSLQILVDDHDAMP